MIISDIPVHQEQNPPYVKFFKSDLSEELADGGATAKLSTE